MKTREELQEYIDELFTKLDFETDEYDDERIARSIIYEIVCRMCRYISPECAERNLTKNRGYNVD